MSIKLVDPNNVNTPYVGDPDIDNNHNPIGTPQYQDMHIFAELTAIPRKRTTIGVDGNQGTGKILTITNTNGSYSKTVNFLGSNQNENFNENNFTTNYYDGSIGNDEIKFEGFGITKIKIDINSSFIPQVNIEFTDIRGLCFFNQGNSPYRILFDFPPPIFQLTVKGYYGGSITYQLHLVKYNSEFNSENGNYVIDCQFVAMTFAPLTDVLFKYVLNFPLMFPEQFPINFSIDDVKPTCTYDLIGKLKRLYSMKDSPITKSVESATIDTNKQMINQINETLSILENCNNNNDGTNELMKEGDIILLDVQYDDTITVLSFAHEFEKHFENNESVSNLYITFPPIQGEFIDPNITVSNDAIISQISRQDTKLNALNTFRETLLNSTKQLGGLVTGGDIPVAFNYFDVDKNKYPTLNVTDFYKKLYVKRTDLSNEIRTSTNKLDKKINSFVNKVLGMTPNIYNVFKLILDDVDFFFQTLRDTAQRAEGLYSSPENLVKITKSDSYVDINKTIKKSNTIYAFPLLINSATEKRLGPTEINDKLGGLFSVELKLIHDFINTFKIDSEIQQTQNARSNTNSDGTYKWIPYSPIDSDIITSTGPYINQNREEVLDLLLKRYYLISQYANDVNFYSGEKENNTIITAAKAEASNLVASLNNTNVTLSLWTTFNNANLQSVYDYYKTTPMYSANNIDHISIDNINIYRSNKAKDFIGLKVDELGSVSTEKRPQGDTDDIVEKYFKNADTEKFLGYFETELIHSDVQYCSTNNLAIKPKPDSVAIDNTSDFYIEGKNKVEAPNNPLVYFWAYNFGREDGNVQWDVKFKNLDLIITNNIGRTTKSILYLSNFGHTRTPFSDYIRKMRSPCIIGCPTYFVAYMGAIIDLNQTSDPIHNAFVNSVMSNLKDMLGSSEYDVIVQDVADINTYVSVNDKKEIKRIYNIFMNSGGVLNPYDVFNDNINIAIQTINNKVYNSVEKTKQYQKYFTDNGKIFNTILNQINLINYSENTFSKLPQHTNFDTLIYTNKDVGKNGKRSKNDLFFNTFITEVRSLLSNKGKEERVKDEAFKKSSGDPDIINETYYSFKNVNDKWIAGTNQTVRGYPFNSQHNGELIKMFRFVDRTLNDIGGSETGSTGVILNPEHLIRMSEDPTLSVFTVLSSLLSLNGFEFFPLQNFMDIDNHEKWKDCFRIDGNPIVDSSPAFVCMYIGGSSSYLTGIESQGAYKDQFTDDCIDDLEHPGVKDFGNSDSVRAFRVRFGEQNQSMFQSIKIDSKEYPETNESIQILARLAGDQGANPPVPKGQNLFNLYENRSYKATISGLGNVKIQPTQYFQLENTPMFRGAYVILGVSHDIVANTMKTSFYGTKVNKFPVPYVSESSSIVGYNSGAYDGVVLPGFSGGFEPNPSPVLADPLYDTPIPTNKITMITTLFNSGSNQNQNKRHHTGIDLAAPIGCEVWAVADGVVIVAETVSQGNSVPGYTGYGSVVVIQHPNNVFILYAHLSSVSVTKGDVVKHSTLLGNVGHSGRSYGITGNHLHYEIRVGVNNGDHAVDPYPYLSKNHKEYDSIRRSISA